MKVKFKIYLLGLLSVLFCEQGFSQLLNVDSCIQVLKTMKEDTNKVYLLDAIAWDISYQNLQEGINYSEKAYDLAKKLNFEHSYSRICNTQGAIYTDMAEMAKALNLFLEGLKYAKKYGQFRTACAITNSLGNLYAKRNDNKKALSYYMESVAIAKKNKMETFAYTSYSNIAGVYTGYKMLDSAMYYLNLCLDYHIKNNRLDRLINNYISLSEIYYAKGEKEKCLSSALKAVDIGRKINDTYTLGHAYIQLSQAYYINKDLTESIHSMQVADSFSRANGDIPSLQIIALNLSELYEEKGDLKNGLKYFKDYKMYADSSLNLESIQQVKNAEAKYENEKKQTEIELLGEKQKVNEALNQKRKIYLTIALVGIAGLIFVLVILYRNNLLKQKTNKNLEAFNKEVNHQKELVEVKNREITDSINYAKRIQQSILTSDNYFRKYTRDFFILFKPKDIVSGDFYWAISHDNKFIVMTGDCTGHGVPGAMMSMMGVNFLNEIVNEKLITSPSQILNHLRSDIIKTLNPEDSTEESKDGMDCSLCSFDFDNLKLTYSNANHNFYVIRNKELIVSSTNKMPVGAGHNSSQGFEEFTMDLEKDDIVITLTDGYADQFGGPKGKKFKYKQFEELLITNVELPLERLKEKLNDAVELWRGNLSQVDDICVIGIKI